MEINTTGKNFWTGILCTRRFETVWETIQYYLTSKGYKGLGPTDFPISCDANTLSGGGNYAESTVKFYSRFESLQNIYEASQRKTLRIKLSLHLVNTQKA